MISVIVPVYNCQRYLAQCIRSVLKQDYRDLELILVNDGSTDKSSKICKKFMALDSRVQLIDRARNLGVEYSRFEGFKKACGEYIFFIDSDDWLDNSHVFSKMVSLIKETGADYVSLGYQRVLSSFKLNKFKIMFNSSGLIDQPELCNKFYTAFFCHNILPLFIAGKLFRKSILDAVYPEPEGYVYQEDLMFFLRIFTKLRKVYIMNDYWYNYRYGGMTSKYNPNIFDDLKRQYFRKKEIFDELHYPSAKMSLYIELKEVLKSRIKCFIWQEEGYRASIQLIDNERNDIIYSELLALDNDSPIWNDTALSWFRDKEYGKIYDTFYKEKWKSKCRQYLKKLIKLLP